jgi:hypothetical protein
MKLERLKVIVISGGPEPVQEAINSAQIPSKGIKRIETFVTQKETYPETTVTVLMWMTSPEKEAHQ